MAENQRAEAFAYDAFISHASADSEDAKRVVALLEKRAVRCWIAPRDLRPGVEYGAEIITGIKSSKTMVVLLSQKSIASVHVRAEVERAVSLGRTVYPARLEDIELSEALEFFLSSNHRIDIFDDPSERNLKVLADAILTSAAPDYAAVKASRSSILKWAVPTAVAGLVLFSLALVYQHFATEMAMRQVDEQVKKAQDLAQQQRAAMLVQAEPELDKLTFSAHAWSDPILKVLVDANSVNLANHYMTSFFRVDGKEASKGSLSFETDGTFKEVEFIVQNTDGEEVARRDVTQDVRLVLERAAKKAISDELKTNQNWGCSIGGCEFRSSRQISMCSPLVNEIAVRTDEQSPWAVLNHNCGNAHNERRLCYTFADFPFDLDPKKSLEFRVMIGDEEPITHRFALSPDRLRFSLRQDNEPSFDHWVHLKAVKDRNPEGPTPIALLAYQARRSGMSGFRLVSGLQGCAKEGKGYVADDGWLVDQDGKGLVRVGRELTFGPVSGAQAAEQLISGMREIAIAADTKDGERKGPYWYIVDPRDAVDLTAQRIEPEVACEAKRFGRQWTCEPTSKIGWIGAQSVKFSNSNDAVPNEIRIDYTTDDFLTKKCDYKSNDCEPFLFKVPEDWENIYYQVIGKKGEVYPKERILLSR